MWNVTDAVELVPLDEDSYYQDPVGFFARLRESRPVAPVRMPDYGRVWIITRYADVRAALTDPRLVNKTLPLAGRRPVPSGSRRGVHAHCSTPTHLSTPGCVAWCRRRSRRAGRQLRPRTKEIAAGLLDELTAAAVRSSICSAGTPAPSRSR